MIVKYYALFDTIAKENIKLITSKDDQTMERSVQYIVRDPKFDKIQGKDLVVNHVFDFDSETGKVVNNEIYPICAVATALARFEAEQLMDLQVELERKASKNVKSSSISSTKKEK